MVLESTMICVDNSDYMRNGDFIPTRLQAQQDAVNLVCHSKRRSNPENNVGLLTLANLEVLATLTSDVGHIISKLHRVQPNGNINMITGIRIAHLALKHCQGKNHKKRIVVFVGSPVETDEKELIKLAKRLKKEKVNVDIVSFGEDTQNNAVLTAFINTLNGKDGASGGSHLFSIQAGDCLDLSSAFSLIGGDGSGPSGAGMSSFEFGVDPNEDPDLALALRVSMEEQRQRQESSSQADPSGISHPEPMELSEEEQIALAMQMSLQQESDSKETETAKEQTEDITEVMSDQEFLQNVLESLSGVDPQSETEEGSKNKKPKEEK